MQISKKHIVMLAALGVAVIVFVADRVTPGGSPTGPDTVQAAVADEPNNNIQPELVSPVSDRETQAAEVRTALAKRLAMVERTHRLGQSSVKDAFFPSPEWVGPREGKVVVDKVPEVDSAVVKANEFARVHVLKGAIVASGRSIAIINGNCVSVGQKIDGFELKSVTANTAVLVCQGVSVTLNLDVVKPGKTN
jgi:hypothetical protein